MKTAKILSVAVLVVVTGAVFAQGKSAAVLLQEGLYAEQTEGDIEKAIGIYEQVLDEARETERLAAKATYQLGMCYLKKGDEAKAAEYFQEVVTKYSKQNVLVKKAKEQLNKVKPKSKKSIITQIDGQVITFFAKKYGETVAQAGQKNLYANSHIYYVDPNFTLYDGGMGYYYNWTGQAITGKTKLTGTSNPDQTLYDTSGQELKTEIVPDDKRSNFYHIFWYPKEPLKPAESLYYGWSMDDVRKLPSKTGQAAELTMKNYFGSPVIETFFLVMPKELKVSQSSQPTGFEELLNFNVYWWTKIVEDGGNHVEQVVLAKEETQYAFGTVIEKVINDGGVGENFMFDIDSGKLFSVSDAKKWSESTGNKNGLEGFIMKSGVDLFGKTSQKSLIGIDMIVMPVHNERWELSPEDVVEQVSMGKAGTPVPLSADGELPKTYVFKTGQGTMGVLQIIKMQDGENPRHFKIRYKVLEKQITGGQYKTHHIVDDTALDIDRGILIGINGDVSQDYDIGWDNDEGGVLMVNPKGGAKIVGLSGVKKGDMQAAIEAAKKSLDMLKRSQSKGILAKQTDYFAVLTDQGNLAVIEIEEYSSHKATINVWMEIKSKNSKLKAEDLIAQGWRLWGQRKLAEAEEKFKDATDVDPDSDGAWQGLGWSQLNQGKKLNAKESFEKCVKINPENSAALNGLGWIAHGQGDIDEAIKWWEKAVKASDGTATASLSGLTQVYMERKEYTEAEKYYKMWLKVEPGNEQAKEGLKIARELQGKQAVSEERINGLIKQLGEQEKVPFTALNKLIKIGEPAVEPLITAMIKSYNWQVPKALGAIGDKRAVGPLIKKWEQVNSSPMNDVVAEALGIITGKEFGKDLEKWQQWWGEVSEFYTPADTIKNFMAAAVKLDKEKAMSFVSPDSHDYGDIKEIFENPEHPFNIMFRSLDESKPTEVTKTNIADSMCSAVWRVTFEKEMDFGKAHFKAGDTFDIDGNLHLYNDKWLITGI